MLLFSTRFDIMIYRQSLALFIWNAVPAVAVVWIRRSGELTFGLTETSGVLCILDITHFCQF